MWGVKKKREDDCRLLPGDIAGIPQNVEHRKNHFLLEYVKTQEPTGMHVKTQTA